MERWACVDVPLLALQLLLESHPDWREHPVAVVDREVAQGTILQVNRHARRYEIRPGMRYAAGLSLNGALRASVVDEEQVAAITDELLDVLHDFSPDVESGAPAASRQKGGPMRRFRRRRGESQDIDISPLIDMVFILLIFFMVSTTFVKDMKLELERPSAQAATRASTKALRVFVDADSNIYVDGLAVKPWMLQSRVRELTAGSTQQAVLVVVDRRVPSERLIEVVDQCRLAGADVAVATEQEAG
jgi:biopolymer transport protein ExbD